MALSWAQLEQLWTAAGGDPARAADAAAVALDESSGNPSSLNDNPQTQDYSVGLWQENYFGDLYGPRTAAYGAPQALLADPTLQARAAVLTSSNGRDWSPWNVPGDAAGTYLTAHGDPALTDAQAQALVTTGAPGPGAPSATFTGVSLNPLTDLGALASGISSLVTDIPRWIVEGLGVMVGVGLIVAGAAVAGHRSGAGSGIFAVGRNAAELAL